MTSLFTALCLNSLLQCRSASEYFRCAARPVRLPVVKSAGLNSITVTMHTMIRRGEADLWLGTRPDTDICRAALRRPPS
eukprot:4999439-Amphidinium_carterae.1